MLETVHLALLHGPYLLNLLNVFGLEFVDPGLRHLLLEFALLGLAFVQLLNLSSLGFEFDDKLLVQVLGAQQVLVTINVAIAHCLDLID